MFALFPQKNDSQHSTSISDWSLLVPLLSLVSALALVAYNLLVYPRWISPLRAFPGPPLGGIIKGQFPAIINGEAGVPQCQWIEEYGSIVRVVGPIGIERLIVACPEALHRILVTNWTDYPRPSFMQYTLGVVAGHGLLTASGDNHKRMKKLLQPAFSAHNVLKYDEMFYDSIDRLVALLTNEIGLEQHGKEILMLSYLNRAAMDIICKTAFGYECGALSEPPSVSKLMEAYERISNEQNGRNATALNAFMAIPGVGPLSISDWPYHCCRFVKRVGAFKPVVALFESMHLIKSIISTFVDDKIAEATDQETHAEAGTRSDMMGILLKARQAEGEGEKNSKEVVIDKKDMLHHVLTFIAAGHDTSANSLTWALYLLAKNPEVQDRLRAEVSPFCSSNCGRPDIRKIKQLQYLDCVINESLRLFPPIPMTFRKSTKDDHLDGKFVPKGTLIYVPIRAVGWLKSVWGDDVAEFRPSRWSDLPPEYNPIYSAFLLGPQSCIGKFMAMLEMKAILASLIGNFEFSLAYEGQVAQPTAAATMKPKDGMPLRVRRVSSR
ncbi:cytochrome P450 [Guyanagaster necrorhizus]|uniref:Cytochrome P450 n=1 Tax=Guyanagaster necrorhizus TaxID=856835 RepID=A0A9P8ANL6_9AGAR|nr:cytochrome P450 [Guyanagaster necrorhizus MCA 3950]KAG7441876.1 cytochrome P450 [Guyanagaster necrorhizus MCA 3950]